MREIQGPEAVAWVEYIRGFVVGQLFLHHMIDTDAGQLEAPLPTILERAVRARVRMSYDLTALFFKMLSNNPNAWNTTWDYEHQKYVWRLSAEQNKMIQDLQDHYRKYW